MGRVEKAALAGAREPLLQDGRLGEEKGQSGTSASRRLFGCANTLPRGGAELLQPHIELVRALDLDSEFHPDSRRLQQVLQNFSDAVVAINASLSNQFFSHPRARVQNDRGVL